MKTVGSFAAKTHLPELLDDVARGDRICITRRGKRVALLVPAEQGETISPKEAVKRFREWRVDIRWRGDDGMTLRQALESGRR